MPDQAVLPELLTGPGDVVLRRWVPIDAELLGRAVGQSLEHVRPWLPWASQEPLSVQRRRETILDWEREWLKGGDVVMGIFLAGQVVGGCGLHRRLDPGGLEIGYWTHPAFVRRGIATTAAGLLTDAAFHVRGISHVEIHVDKSNDVSLAIPRKLGYRLIAEESVEPVAPNELGLRCIWRLTREEWRSRGGMP
ncbi:MAG TPA: GNAT family protein [Solirubrobacteraceae bacterium]|nr:GNAT family protein [Solirubrobacteraceae bacterium]